MSDEHRYATIDGNKYRLASWVPRDERYQDVYIPLDPALRFLPNRGDGLVADEGSTYWSVKSWDGGEGFDQWDPEQKGFASGIGVRRQRGLEGLVLGPKWSNPTDGSVATAIGGRFGYALGSVWAADDAADGLHEWDDALSQWGDAATGDLDDVTSIADAQDGSNVMIMLSDGSIRKVNQSANSQHFAAGTFSADAVLEAWGGRMFALDGDDLYEIDLSTVDTRTLIADAGGSSTVFLASTPSCWHRMAKSDKGPIWLQRLDSGETFIWEYNVAQEVGFRSGKLPLDYAWPYDIMYANGFTFVAFRAANSPTATGLAYIYFQRGAQRGVLGPIDRGATTAAPIYFAGMSGADLLFAYDDSLWAYSLASGGLFRIATPSSTALSNIGGAILLGDDVFVSELTNGRTFRFELSKYTTEANPELESGRYDLAYFDIPKLFLDVTVFTEPLAANTSVALSYAVDGGSFTAATGTHDTDGATTFTWDLSTSSTTVRGRQLEIRLEPSSSSEDATPIIRGFLVRGISGAHERRIVLVIDCSTDDAGEQEVETVLSNLRTLAAKDEIVSLSLPFESRDQTAEETLDVSVRTVRIPEAYTARPVAVVELQQKALTS